MSEDDNSTLTRRRVLGGIATVGAASAAAGAGTMAYFSDTETSSGNTLSAGTLNLDPEGSSGGSFDMTVSGLAPNDSGQQVGYLDLKNTGSVDGTLDYEITGIIDYENGQNDAESAVDSSDGNNAGELSDHLEIRAYVDRTPADGTRNDDEAITSGWVPLSQGLVDTDISVSAGEAIRIWVDARIPSGTGNEVQSDSVEIAAAFHLEQA